MDKRFEDLMYNSGDAVSYKHKFDLRKDFNQNMTLMLSQALFWYKIADKKGKDHFFKRDKDWCLEISKSIFDVRNAKKRLKDLGVWDTKRHGIGKAMRVHYYLNTDRICELYEEALTIKPNLGNGKELKDE